MVMTKNPLMLLINIWFRFPYTYLEHSEESNGKRVEIGWRCSIGEIELTTKQLHTKESEYEDEQEEKKQQGNNGSHGIEKRYHKIS